MKKSFAFFFIFLTFLAILRLFLFFSEKVSYRDSQEISLQTRILSDPKIQGSTQRITVHLRGGKNAFVYLPLYPEIRYGDLVRIEGRLKIKKIEDGEIIFINFPKAEKVEDRNWAIKTLADSREKIITSFQRVLPIPSSSLLLGIVFG
ncbi:MAG: hypothetical protein HYT09_03605, partial [Candidatus Levybacteria bacterium]|nr:hypothetical protein [Candidatus Levybacteria bacterium]